MAYPPYVQSALAWPQQLPGDPGQFVLLFIRALQFFCPVLYRRFYWEPSAANCISYKSKASQLKPTKYGKTHGLEPHRPPNSGRVTASLSSHRNAKLSTFLRLFRVIPVNFILIGHRKCASRELALCATRNFAILVFDIALPVVWTFLPVTPSQRSTMQGVYWGVRRDQLSAHHLRHSVTSAVLDASRQFRRVGCTFSNLQIAASSFLALRGVIFVIPKTAEAVQIRTEYWNNDCVLEPSWSR